MPAHATLFDGTSALGQPVSATLDGPHLRLLAADGATLAPWVLAAIVRCDPGASATSAVFRQQGDGRQQAPARLCVTDAALLAGLRQAGVAFGGTAPWTARRWGAFAAGFAGSLLLLAVLIDRVPALAVPLVPPALERGWSDTIEGVLSANVRICDDPAAGAALSGLVARLAASGGLAGPPRLVVLDTGLVNAFTLPDGRILLLRGLIDKAGGPDELSGVLAHEIGHVRRHDPTREMLRGLALNMVARSLGWGSSVAGQMAALSYGRRAEAAADAAAATTLRRAGLRTDGLRRFFLRLQGEGAEAPLPFLSDHPATSARIAALPADTAGLTALTPREWHSVRAACAAGPALAPPPEHATRAPPPADDPAPPPP